MWIIKNLAKKIKPSGYSTLPLATRIFNLTFRLASELISMDYKYSIYFLIKFFL